ncbi:hypothetical protein IFM89_021878 [Coptis chinensis]|uniref:15-cis-phytoene synthase n=1 Tax=Coptis chinensis TaxID=261450 RepID=A0A835HJ24_9MAGN|nr:hypothetical protein IFM89_021878 [Coptis chinensis]
MSTATIVLELLVWPIKITNILRDVGEDALAGRVYLPQDELAAFGLSAKDIFAMKVSEKWKEFMKFQIERVRFYFSLAGEGAASFDLAFRLSIWTMLVSYQTVLGEIEDNNYDNLTKKSIWWEDQEASYAATSIH